MRYTYIAPRDAEYKVDWDLSTMPGIYDTGKREFLSSVKLCKELIDWLNANSPGWSFRSDSDFNNSGDDDEGCHLKVNSSEAADGFIAEAKRISQAWVDADELKKPYRVFLIRPEKGEEEIFRSYTPTNLHYQVHHRIQCYLPHEWDRRYGHFAEEDVIKAARKIAESDETEVSIPLRLYSPEQMKEDTTGYEVKLRYIPPPADIIPS